MTELYAVRFPDGSYMNPRKPFGDTPSFVVFTDPAHAGNAVVWMKEQGKLPADAEYEVVKIGNAYVKSITFDELSESLPVEDGL